MKWQFYVPLIAVTVLVAGITEVHAEATAQAAPRVFAPGVISTADYDASPAFTPDGKRVFFTIVTATSATIMVSHRDGAGWSKPRVASFSRQWHNFEPTMAPDGSFIVFVSNRPIDAGKKKPLDGYFNGKHWPGGGGNLWRVDRQGDGLSAPHRLPTVINRNTSIFSPSIAADGSIYFMQADPKSGYFHIWRSALVNGMYQKPIRMKLGAADTEEVDPAVAPDESFIVFSLKHPARKDPNRLQIAFRDGGGWSKPIDLGDTINATSNVEARLGGDGRTLYFSSGRSIDQDAGGGSKAAWNNGKSNIWYVSLAPWLKPHQVLQDRLQPLSFFVGDWSCAGRFANGESISSRETFSPALNGRWLEMHHSDKPPHQYDAIEMWRYDAAAKKFDIYVFDDFGGSRHYDASGWQGDKMALHNAVAKGYVDRFVYRRLNGSEYRVAYAHRDNAGKWVPGDALTCTRD